ncbi:unnamed protein product, partial [Leptidea sinapis]
MLDALVPTSAANWSTTFDHQNFYVTFYDETVGDYLLWTVLFAGMVVVSTVGNLVVIWIVLANKRMRSVTNYFLVNLSIADTMMSTLNVTFNFTYMLYSDWPFGDFYCRFCQRVCYSDWPDGITTRSQLEYMYNIIYMLLTYFLPIMSMTYTYAKVGRELWGSKSIGECTQRQLE